MKPTLTAEEFNAQFLAACQVEPTLTPAEIVAAWRDGQSPTALAEESDQIEMWIEPEQGCNDAS